MMVVVGSTVLPTITVVGPGETTVGLHIICNSRPGKYIQNMHNLAAGINLTVKIVQLAVINTKQVKVGALSIIHAGNNVTNLFEGICYCL